MQLLKERILRDGRALNEDVLLVDAFLNHQVDPALMQAIGEEFARRFKSVGITRVITIEASGIAPALMTALALRVPLVVMKKNMSSILNEDLLKTEVYSFTKGAPYQLTMKRKYLEKGDRVLFIDDFLANGEAALGAARLIKLAGAQVSGIGAVICKAFQPGLKKLEDAGYRVETLARIRQMSASSIEFEDR